MNEPLVFYNGGLKAGVEAKDINVFQSGIERNLEEKMTPGEDKLHRAPLGDIGGFYAHIQENKAQTLLYVRRAQKNFNYNSDTASYIYKWKINPNARIFIMPGDEDAAGSITVEMLKELSKNYDLITDKDGSEWLMLNNSIFNEWEMLDPVEAFKTYFKENGFELTDSIMRFVQDNIILAEDVSKYADLIRQVDSLGLLNMFDNIGLRDNEVSFAFLQILKEIVPNIVIDEELVHFVYGMGRWIKQLFQNGKLSTIKDINNAMTAMLEKSAMEWASPISSSQQIYFNDLINRKNKTNFAAKAILPENQEKVNNMIAEGKSPFGIAAFVAVKEFFKSLDPKKFTLAHAQDGQTFKEAIKDNPAPLIVSLSAWLAIAALSILNPFALPLIFAAPVSIAVGSILNLVIHTIIDYAHITVFLKPALEAALKAANKKAMQVNVPDEVVEKEDNGENEELTVENKQKLSDYRDALKEVINEIYGESHYPELEKEIKEIFEKLLDAMIRMGSISPEDKKEYELIFYDTSQFNAYTIKTTKTVFLTSAVIEQLNKYFIDELSKDHIAAILGHELQHTIQKNKNINSIFEQHGDDNKREYDSDVEALYIMDNAGFNPEAFSEVMDSFVESNLNPYLGFAISLIDQHPDSKDRLEMINKVLGSKNTTFRNITLEYTLLNNSDIDDEDTLLETIAESIKTRKDLEKAFEKHKNIYDILYLLPKKRYKSIQLKEFIKTQLIDKTYSDYSIQEKEIIFELLYGAFFNDDVTNRAIKALHDPYGHSPLDNGFFRNTMDKRYNKIIKLIDELDADSQHKLKNWIADCKISSPVDNGKDRPTNINFRWFSDMSVVYLRTFSYISQKLNYQDFEKDYNRMGRRYDVIQELSQMLLASKDAVIWRFKDYEETALFMKKHFNDFSDDLQKVIIKYYGFDFNEIAKSNFDSYIAILEIIYKSGYSHEISLSAPTIDFSIKIIKKIKDADKRFHCIKVLYDVLYASGTNTDHKFFRFVVENSKNSKKTIKEIFEAGILPLPDDKYFFET
ncbi:MAG: M48 family metalloprotease [Endomicrobium sp.]|nr:M48 family metalloprotease [Endomicrobium sp.]